MDINGQWKDCATLQRKLKRSPSSSSSAWPWRPSLQPFVEQAAGVGLSQEADCLLPAGALVVDQLVVDQLRRTRWRRSRWRRSRWWWWRCWCWGRWRCGACWTALRAWGCQAPGGAVPRLCEPHSDRGLRRPESSFNAIPVAWSKLALLESHTTECYPRNGFCRKQLWTSMHISTVS